MQGTDAKTCDIYVQFCEMGCDDAN